MVATIEVLRPVSKKFYCGILVVNLLHLSAVIFITALFWSRCRYLLLGDKRIVFASFRSRETEPWGEGRRG